MQGIETFFLENRLKVILWPWDRSDKVVFNMLINVGAKDENPHQTGLAHLFEHLMFGKSQHLSVSYDEAIEKVGGNSNAFTSPDITCYEVEIPASVLEYLLWLESDRFFYLDLSEKQVETQKKVVIEEFYEGYLNAPYGDAYHHLLDLAFPESSYNWPTIGKTPEHIQSITPQIAWDFYTQHYTPDNTTMILSGKLPSNIESILHKWFVEPGLERDGKPKNPYSPQPPYSSIRRKIHYGQVPFPRLYRAYLIPGMRSLDILPFQVFQELATGADGFLYFHLVVEENACTHISSSIYGMHEQALWVITAQTTTVKELEHLSSLLDQQLEAILFNRITQKDVEYAQNQYLLTLYQTRNHLTNGTSDLIYMDSLGLLHYWGKEEELLFSLSPQKIQNTVAEFLLKHPYAELWYLPIESSHSSD